MVEMQSPGLGSYKCWFMGWGWGDRSVPCPQASQVSLMQVAHGPHFQKLTRSWMSLVENMRRRAWGGWFFGSGDISNQNHLSANSLVLLALPHIFLPHQNKLAKLVFWGQIEMPKCMEINHRIIQTAAYHLPYIWHNYPTSNMKMLYCNNSEPEEKAVLLITWK